MLDAIRPVTDAIAPFRFSLCGVGAFPNPRRARVAWVGLQEGAEAATHLAARLESALRPLGFSPERRPWRAHVTLGRFRAPRTLDLPDGDAERLWGSAEATRLTLYRSELSPQGAHHHVVEELSLLGVI